MPYVLRMVFERPVKEDMIVSINGGEKEVEDGVTLKALLDLFEIKTQGVAVEVNKEVVPKRLYAATIIKERDAVEIIRMVGGG